MSGGELSAVFKGLAEDADQAAGNIAHSIADVSERTADIEESNLARTLDNEATTAQAFDRIREPPVPEPPSSINSRLGGGEPPAEPDALTAGRVDRRRGDGRAALRQKRGHQAALGSLPSCFSWIRPSTISLTASTARGDPEAAK